MSVTLRKATDSKPRIEQCEGCYEPLGYRLEDGYEISDFDVVWYLCPTHNVEYDNGAASNLDYGDDSFYGGY